MSKYCGRISMVSRCILIYHHTYQYSSHERAARNSVTAFLQLIYYGSHKLTNIVSNIYKIAHTLNKKAISKNNDDNFAICEQNFIEFFFSSYKQFTGNAMEYGECADDVDGLLS